jgi:hypothetical protein
MAPSTAKVLSAHACHVTAAETAEVASAEAADVTSTKSADVATAEATAHVASATSATAAAGLGIGGQKAAGKHCTCQNHHHSSSHDILLLESAGPSRHKISSASGVCQRQTPTSR